MKTIRVVGVALVAGMTTLTGFAFLGSKVGDVEPTWAVFDRADLKGRMTLLNDMRETIGAALKSLGYKA